MSPTVSVLVPHYGDPGPTRALVAQLSPQVARVGGEILVVDDASPVPVEDVVGARVVRREVNGGFGTAVNTGARLARGELLAILNSDLSVQPDFLEAYLAAALPWMPAVVAPRVVTPGHPGATTFRFPTPLSLAAQRVALVAVRRSTSWGAWLIGETRVAATETALVDWVSGAAMLVPRSDFCDVGGFDERFHMYMEEVDLQHRLRARGLPSVRVGAVSVEHVGAASSDPARRELWQLESWFAYAAKHGWEQRLRLALAVASGMTLASESARRLAGRDVAPLAGWRRAGQMRRAAWEAYGRRQA